MNEQFFERLDVDGALAESATDAGLVSRGGFLVAAAGSAALLGLGAEAADAQKRKKGKKRKNDGPNDRAILNYALVLEYLQASFYTEAERLGALRDEAKQAARQVGSVERAHVKAFLDVLGRNAVKRPSFDFQGVTEDQDAFLKTAVAFEDLAVAAYKGQARRLRSKAVLTSALGIHTVEARHAAWMRYLNGNTPAAAAFDVPRSRREIDEIVSSTNFISGRPTTSSRRTPRFSG